MIRRHNIIGAVLLIIAFGLGMLMGAKPADKDLSVVEEPATIVVETLVNSHEWSRQIGDVMATAMDEAGSYEAQIAFEGKPTKVVIPINWMEYIILEVGDQIDMLVIEERQEGAYVYADVIRDADGRLILHEDRPIVVVDPGHGGGEDGEGSNDQWVEKDLNLAMSLRMKEALESRGLRVIMTRDEDVYINLYDRVALANYVEADMLISNHLNKMDTKASGVEVLYSSLSDRTFANSLAFTIAGEDFGVYSVYNRKQGGALKSDFYSIHKYCEGPSYIIEYGFADNEADTVYVMEHWETLVQRASGAIAEHLGK